MEYVLQYATELLLLLFLVITFLQSGLDKVLDWKGNLGWLTGHFEKTPLKAVVPLLLGTITVVEVVAGVLSALGMYQLLASGETDLALYGAVLSCVALMMLLFGQRMAKDYVGAKTIVVYFMPAVFLVYLLQG
ncbi:DoxX family protein [Maribacter sp. 2307ULW6-5]|uniref:DoxX family protein n=1 Tax=Maribacter sp. 2307ULW6-5 TaxID=3386275 RepID=UPI0039BD01CF